MTAIYKSEQTTLKLGSWVIMNLWKLWLWEFLVVDDAVVALKWAFTSREFQEKGTSQVCTFNAQGHGEENRTLQENSFSSGFMSRISNFLSFGFFFLFLQKLPLQKHKNSLLDAWAIDLLNPLQVRLSWISATALCLTTEPECRPVIFLLVARSQWPCLFVPPAPWILPYFAQEEKLFWLFSKL